MTKYGFPIKNSKKEVARVNHLLYMDDLKLLGATANQLQQMLRIVEEYSNDIKMEFGLNKCRTINIVRGKVQEGGLKMQNGQNIAEWKHRIPINT